MLHGPILPAKRLLKKIVLQEALVRPFRASSLSAAATSPTVASFTWLSSFTEDFSLETDADATPATNRAQAAIFMFAACLGERKQNTEWKNLNRNVAAVNWKVNPCHTNLTKLTTMHLPKGGNNDAFFTLLYFIGVQDRKSSHRSQACWR